MMAHLSEAVEHPFPPETQHLEWVRAQGHPGAAHLTRASSCETMVFATQQRFSL